MKKLWVVPLLLAGPASAEPQFSDVAAKRTVLSARLCIFEIGVRGPRDENAEKPETWRALARFTRQQLRDIKRTPLPCSALWVRRTMACLGRVYGEVNIPLACVHGAMWSLTLTDKELPLPDDQAEQPKEEEVPSILSSPGRN